MQLEGTYNKIIPDSQYITDSGDESIEKHKEKTMINMILPSSITFATFTQLENIIQENIPKPSVVTNTMNTCFQPWRTGVLEGMQDLKNNHDFCSNTQYQLIKNIIHIPLVENEPKDNIPELILAHLETINELYEDYKSYSEKLYMYDNMYYLSMGNDNFHTWVFYSDPYKRPDENFTLVISCELKSASKISYTIKNKLSYVLIFQQKVFIHLINRNHNDFIMSHVCDYTHNKIIPDGLDQMDINTVKTTVFPAYIIGEVRQIQNTINNNYGYVTGHHRANSD